MGSPTVTVRYFAGARAAAGVDTETRAAGSLDELVAQERERLAQFDAARQKTEEQRGRLG